MAMFEKEGFCPNKFFPSGTARTMLQSRIAYMVYDNKDTEYGSYRSTIVECLDCGDEAFIIQVCSHLQAIIPVCIYAEKGRKIRIHDLVSPYQCADDLIQMGDLDRWNWSFTEHGHANENHPLLSKDSRRIFFNNDWFVMIDNHGGEETDTVDIYLFYRR